MEPGAHVDTWTVGHALGLLSAALIAEWVHDARPVAVVGGLSMLGLVALHQGRFTHGGGFGVANSVTLLRVALTVALSALGASAPGPSAALLVLVILALDCVDGWLARRYGLASAFGARFDMESDALLVLVASLVLHLAGRLGVFILLPGLLRYLYVLAQHVLPPPRREAPRTTLGRAVFGVMVLSLAGSLWPVAPWHAWSALGATLLLVFSFARSMSASRMP